MFLGIKDGIVVHMVFRNGNKVNFILLDLQCKYSLAFLTFKKQFQKIKNL